MERLLFQLIERVVMVAAGLFEIDARRGEKC